MTKAQFTRIFRGWQTRLDLDHWNITINWDEEPGSYQALASVSTENTYDLAELRLDREWREWDVFLANRIASHELLHLVFRDLDQAEQSALGPLSYDARVLLAERLEHETEGVIDRLAQRFVKLAGVIE